LQDNILRGERVNSRAELARQRKYNQKLSAKLRAVTLVFYLKITISSRFRQMHGSGSSNSDSDYTRLLNLRLSTDLNQTNLPPLLSPVSEHLVLEASTTEHKHRGPPQSSLGFVHTWSPKLKGYCADSRPFFEVRISLIYVFLRSWQSLTDNLSQDLLSLRDFEIQLPVSDFALRRLLLFY
jgi:hypothetical protein